MKRIIAILLALALMLCLCACAEEDGARTPNEPDGQNQPADPDPEPEEPKPEPPIEVSEFSAPEDMPAPFDGGAPESFTDETLAVFVGDRAFTPEWLYYQDIHDWVQAGITYDQISEKTGSYLDLPLTADALAAFKDKISEFTMIVMLTSGDGSTNPAPSITVGDEVYDFEWLTSHNATEYTEAGIPASTIKDYMDAIKETHGYTPEYRWIEIVHDRLVNGW